MNIKQKRIIRTLVESNGKRYSDLFKLFEYEDRFSYHLKQLLTKNLIHKRDNLYYLTKQGMAASALFDRKTLEDIKYPTPLIILICKYEDKYFISEHFSEDKNKERIFYTLPAAKPLWGLTLEESCKKEFLRKNKMEGDYKYQSTFHLINFTSDKDILFDNIFLVFICDLYKESYEKIKMRINWMTLAEIRKLKNRSITLERLIIENNQDQFIEDKVILNYGFEDKDL